MARVEGSVGNTTDKSMLHNDRGGRGHIWGNTIVRKTPEDEAAEGIHVEWKPIGSYLHHMLYFEGVSIQADTHVRPHLAGRPCGGLGHQGATWTTC